MLLIHIVLCERNSMKSGRGVTFIVPILRAATIDYCNKKSLPENKKYIFSMFTLNDIIPVHNLTKISVKL